MYWIYIYNSISKKVKTTCISDVGRTYGHRYVCISTFSQTIINQHLPRWTVNSDRASSSWDLFKLYQSHITINNITYCINLSISRIPRKKDDTTMLLLFQFHMYLQLLDTMDSGKRVARASAFIYKVLITTCTHNNWYLQPWTETEVWSIRYIIWDLRYDHQRMLNTEIIRPIVLSMFCFMAFW